MPESTVSVIAHAHWDREWYRTFQDYRLRLVDLMDDLLALLDARPAFTSFLLDGQTILLDDFLAVRPERAADVRRLAQAGRLELGPWYVQPDETLVSGEALMRNLRLGQITAAEFGGSCDCGWLPDTFGHIAQLPQILRGFGIETLVFTRGLGDEPVAPAGGFWLQAPSGHRVLAAHQTGGYVNGGNLGHASFWGPADPRETDLSLATRQVERLILALDPAGQDGPLAIWNGADHTPPQPDLPEIIAHLNRVFPRRTFTQASLSDYLARLKTVGERLPVVEGELRGSRYQPLLAGVLSARMPLKQANAVAERDLLRYVEPLATLAWSAGQDYPRAAIDLAWQLTLQNQCHDSICGCHIDRVTDEMLSRYRQVEDLTAELTGRALRALSLAAQPRAPKGAHPLLVVNTLPVCRSEVARARVRLPRVVEDYSVAQGTGARPAQTLASAVRDYEWLNGEVTAEEFLAFAPMWQASLADMDGLGLAAHTVERQGHAVDLTIWLAERAWVSGEAASALLAEVASWPPLTPVRMRARYYEVELAFEAHCAGLGGTAHVLRESRADAAIGSPVCAGPRWLANGIVRVEVDDLGRITLSDAMTGRVAGPLCALEDGADAGDTYDYAPLRGEPTRLLEPAEAPVEVLSAGPLVGALRVAMRCAVPVGLSGDRAQRTAATVALPVALTVQMTAGSPLVEVMLELDNAARDHRLRALFRTGLHAETVHAGAPFGVSARPVALPEPEGWRQPRAATRPHTNWVGVADEAGGLAILTEGLPEHEPLVEDGQVTLAVTLLRGVGSLSRGDLLTRRGHAGPAIATPSAQCLGPHRFRFGVALSAPDAWAGVSNLAEMFLAPPIVAPLSVGRSVAEPFLTLQPDFLVLSSLTVSEDGADAVARFYNPTPQPVDAALRFGAPVQRVVKSDARGEERAPLTAPPDARQWSLEVGPAEIVTVLIRP